MSQEIEEFIREQKAKFAQEKARIDRPDIPRNEVPVSKLEIRL